MTDREKYLTILDRFYRGRGGSLLTKDESEALDYAISSIKTDLKYDLLYEETKHIADADKIIESTTKNDLGVELISREDVLQILLDYDYANENALVIKDIKALPSVTPQEPCKDCISRKSIKQKLQEHHDFFVNAYGGFSNLPRNDKSRVDEITNCIAMVVNEPSVTPQEPRWIPVSERLPKAECGESNSVLVCFENGTQDVLYFNGSNWCYPTGETYISVNHKNDWHNKVVAWMPLPTSYREVEE